MDLFEHVTNIKRTPNLYTKFTKAAILIAALFTLAACQFSPLQPQPEVSASPPAATESELLIEPTQPLSAEQAQPPILFQLPELDIEFRVSSMGWTVVEENGIRTTQWVVPIDSAGWHINSVGAGGLGNIVLSGQQAIGDAVFAPLALGEIQQGQTILLTAQDGQVYAYEVTEVSQPIPTIGATEADNKAAAAYGVATTDARLTLITGWPDFSTTHRIFAVASFVGRVQTK